MFSVRRAIDSEFKALLTLPEFFRFKSFDFSHLRPEVLLIVVIEIRNVFLVMYGVSVFVENEFAEVGVFKDVLSMTAESVVKRDDSLAEGMDEPFGLEHDFADDSHGMIVNFDVGFINIIQSPNSIPSQISVMLGRIVDSTLSSGDDLFFFEFFDSCDLFVGLFNFLDVTSVLFAIEIVLKLVFFVLVIF